MKRSDSNGVSRRRAIQTAAAAASASPLVQLAFGQAPQGGAAQGAPARGRGGRGGGMGGRGGRGPIQVLLITKGHPFSPWEEFFACFDSMGQDITWTHVEQPAAEVFMNPETSKRFDVFVQYDVANWVGGDRNRPPSPELQTGFRDMLRQGKGIVYFHHSIASWNYWPEFKEVQGAGADWGAPIKIRGVDYPKSGFRGNTDQTITVVDKNHPITAGLPEKFEINDETYLCPMFEDSVHPLLRTNFVPKVENFERIHESTPGWNHPPGSNLTGWYKSAENSPIAYIQHGHGEAAWKNEYFRKLMDNAIKWAASKEAMDWAKAHPSKIWKS